MWFGIGLTPSLIVVFHNIHYVMNGFICDYVRLQRVLHRVKKYTAWEFKTTAVVGKALKISEIKNVLPA